jgi:hypothetical protein
MSVGDLTGAAIQGQQPGGIPLLKRSLGNQFLR